MRSTSGPRSSLGVCLSRLGATETRPFDTPFSTIRFIDSPIARSLHVKSMRCLSRREACP